MTTAAAIRQIAQMARLGQTENVVYRPAAGGRRSVLAMVVRRPPAPEMSGASAVIEVTVLNDASAGISAAELNGRDTLEVAERLGGATQARMIADKVLSQDPEFVTVEVR